MFFDIKKLGLKKKQEKTISNESGQNIASSSPNGKTESNITLQELTQVADASSRYFDTNAQILTRPETSLKCLIIDCSPINYIDTPGFNGLKNVLNLMKLYYNVFLV